MIDHEVMAEFQSQTMDMRRLESIAGLIPKIQHVPGDIVDIGSGSGLTAAFLQRCLSEFGIDKKIHCYDAFPTGEVPIGNCSASVDFSKIPTNAKAGKARLLRTFRGFEMPLPAVHPGWLVDTLPGELPECIAFVHIDVDMYQPTMEALLHTYDRLPGGAICVIDDYGLGFLPCVKRAVNEFLAGKDENIVQTVSGIQGMFVRQRAVPAVEVQAEVEPIEETEAVERDEAS